MNNEQQLLQFRCPHCSVRLRAKRADAGASRKCPGCQKSFRIPRPKVKEDSPAPAVEKVLVPVICGVCRTRIYATDDQIGGLIECPDCFTQNVVKEPPQGIKKRDVVAAAGMTYDMRPESVLSVPKSYADELMEDADRKVEKEIEEAPVVPNRPLVSGVFTFPFYRHAFPVVLGMAIGLSFEFAIIKTAFTLQGPSAAFFAPILMVAAAIAGFFTVLPSMVCLIYVFENSVQGDDDAECRPEGGMLGFFDWFADVFYLVFAVALSAGPWAVVRLFVDVPIDFLPGMILISSLAFPVVLLSMMENSSPLGFYSAPIWSSLRKLPWPWFQFYFIGTILIVLCGACGLGLGQLTERYGWTGPVILGSIGLVYGLCILATIYFRLLGRLGWVLTQEVTIFVQDPPDDDDAETAVSRSSRQRSLPGVK